MLIILLYSFRVILEIWYIAYITYFLNNRRGFFVLLLKEILLKIFILIINLFDLEKLEHIVLVKEVYKLKYNSNNQKP